MPVTLSADDKNAMEISADQFADILKNLGSPSSRGGDGSEHRRAPRVNRRARIRVIPINNGVEQTALQVLMRDLSARGMCIIHRAALAPGTQLLACFPGEAGAHTLVLCAVAHCRQLSKDAYMIGMEFTCRVPRPSERSTQSDYDRIRQSILD